MNGSPAVFGLSRWQMGVLVFCVTLCVTPFVYDSSILLQLHRLAWAAVLPAYAVGLAGTAVAVALIRRFPGESILDYAPRVLGAWPGRAYLVLLGAMLLAGAPVNLRVLTEVVRFNELPRTTTYIPALIFTGVVGLACYFGPEVFARMGELLSWPIAVGLFFIFFAPFATAVPGRLLPLTGFSLGGYLTPEVSSSLGTVRGFLCLLVLGGTLGGGTRGLGRYTFGALSLAALLLLLSIALPEMVLGTGFAEQLRYPILGVTGTVSFQWFPFQRLTILTVLVWQMLMYVVLAFYLWSGIYVLAAAFGSHDWRLWLPPAAAAAVWGGAVHLVPSVSQALTDTWNFSVVALGVVAPALLWFVAALRARPAVKSP